MALMTDAEIQEQIIRPNAKLAVKRDKASFPSSKAQRDAYRANAVTMLQARGYTYIAETKVRRMWQKTLREEINALSVDKPEGPR